MINNNNPFGNISNKTSEEVSQEDFDFKNHSLDVSKTSTDNNTKAFKMDSIFDNNGNFYYDGDGQYSYAITDFLKNVEEKSNTKIDLHKFNALIKNNNVSSKEISDATIYNYLDINKDKKLDFSEIAIMIDATKIQASTPTPTPTPAPVSQKQATAAIIKPTPESKSKTIDYASDAQHDYDIHNFIKKIEADYNVSLDEAKFRTLIGNNLTNKSIFTDYDLFNYLDLNKDLKLDDAEINKIIDKTRKTNTTNTVPTHNPINQQTLQQMMYPMMQQMMYPMMLQMIQNMLPSIMSNQMRPQQYQQQYPQNYTPNNQYNVYGMSIPIMGQ